MDYEFIKPIAGGGLGDCKIGIVEFSGEYTSGGIDIGLKSEPMFMVANMNLAVFDSSTNKIKILSAVGDEYADGDQMDGQKVLFVYKGSI